MADKTYVVIPFERKGAMIGPRCAFLVDAISNAKQIAQQIAGQVPGVAILERAVDPDTGADQDTLVAHIGAVPPSFPAASMWSMRLH